jgi:hypothetical protein
MASFLISSSTHPILDPDRAQHIDWEATYSFNRAARENEYLINQVPPTGRLTDGAELARVRAFSKTADLEVTGIESVTNALAGWGPRLDELDFTGDDYLPDMMAFVETQIETFAPAFSRPQSSLLLP